MERTKQTKTIDYLDQWAQPPHKSEQPLCQVTELSCLCLEDGKCTARYCPERDGKKKHPDNPAKVTAGGG